MRDKIIKIRDEMVLAINGHHSPKNECGCGRCIDDQNVIECGIDKICKLVEEEYPNPLNADEVTLAFFRKYLGLPKATLQELCCKCLDLFERIKVLERALEIACNMDNFIEATPEDMRNEFIKQAEEELNDANKKS